MSDTVKGGRLFKDLDTGRAGLDNAGIEITQGVKDMTLVSSVRRASTIFGKTVMKKDVDIKDVDGKVYKVRRESYEKFIDRSLSVTDGMHVAFGLVEIRDISQRTKGDNALSKSLMGVDLVEDNVYTGNFDELFKGKTPEQIRNAMELIPMRYFSITDINGETLLNRLIANDHKEAAKFVIENRGVDVNKPVELEVAPALYGKKQVAPTPLHAAIQAGNTDMVKFLLSKKANINTGDNNKNTPLHLAVLENNYDIVKLLLSDKTINKNAKNAKNQTPIDLANEIVKTKPPETLDPNIYRALFGVGPKPPEQ